MASRVALLAFKTAYRRAGLELSPDELPDHLAVVLEYAATVDPKYGRRILLDHRAGVELLRLALEDAGSPYVDVVRAICATLPPLTGDDAEMGSPPQRFSHRPRNLLIDYGVRRSTRGEA